MVSIRNFFRGEPKKKTEKVEKEKKVERLRPLNDNLIVRPVVEQMSPGGIDLSAANKGAPDTGIVIEVGPGKLLDHGTRSEMEVSQGDKIVFDKYGTTDIKYNGADCKVVNITKVLAVFEQN